ncbi:MAG: LysR family transcriptional regulator [Bdellovibrionota bacterium]|nr:LysR family transcriptional regulator [Bdellovibrionota bacterium]
MNLNYLECFASLSETLSFTETAKNFSVSQPSISRQIKLLEEQLNTKLFIRDKHKVYLTEEGKSFKHRVTPLISELQSVMSNTQERTDEVKGSVHFGCLGEVGQNSLMQRILEFNALNSSINLQISYASPQDIIENVKAGIFDFGLVNELVDQENIRTYDIIKERSVLITGGKNKERLADINSAKFVCYSDDDSLLLSYIHKYHKKASFSKLQRHVIVNSHRSMIDAVEATNGYAVLPYFSVEKALKEKRIRIASDKELTSSLYLIHIDNNLMPKKNSLFKQFLIETCKKQQI